MFDDPFGAFGADLKTSNEPCSNHSEQGISNITQCFSIIIRASLTKNLL